MVGAAAAHLRSLSFASRRRNTLSSRVRDGISVASRPRSLRLLENLGNNIATGRGWRARRMARR